MSRKDDVRQLIDRYSRTLQKLKERVASFGPLHTPPHVLIEIEDIEGEINRLQEELKALEGVADGISTDVTVKKFKNYPRWILVIIILTLAFPIVLFAVQPSRSFIITTLFGATTLDVKFEDNFGSNVKDWREVDENDHFLDREIRVVNGIYQMSVKAKADEMFYWSPVPRSLILKDFQLQVDATVREASELVDVLVLFRAEETSEGDLYIVGFRNDNSYYLTVRREGKFKTLYRIPNSKVFRLDSGIKNSFAILVKGSSITIFANGERLLAVEETILTEGGKIGIGVALINTGDVATVEFDNLVITEVRE